MRNPVSIGGPRNPVTIRGSRNPVTLSGARNPVTDRGSRNPVTFIGEVTPAPPIVIEPATVRSASSVTYGSRTNTTITAPTGVADGDLLIAAVYVGITSELGAPSVTPPSGWTLQTTGGLLYIGGFCARVHIYTKTASGEGANYTWTHVTASSEVYIYCLNNPSGIAPTIILTSDLSQTCVTGNLSTTYTNTLCLYIASCWQAWGTSNPPNGTTPTLVERQDSATNVLYTADASLATAGAFGQRSQTNKNVGAEPCTATVILMSPRVSGEVPTLCRFEDSTNGTSVTATILTNGSTGLPPGSAWAMGGTGDATTMKVSTAAERSVPGLSYGGSAFTDTGTRGISVNCGGGLNRYGELVLTANGLPIISLGHAIKIPAAYIGTFGTFDLTSMQGNGNFGVCQMFCDASQINWHAHTQAGTGDDITIPADTWVWLTLLVDRPGGVCTLRAYNMESSMSLLGESTLAFDTGELNDIRSIFIGHIDPHGEAVSADILIDDLAIDYTGLFPLLPV